MLCGTGATADDIFDALCVLSEKSEVKDHWTRWPYLVEGCAAMNFGRVNKSLLSNIHLLSIKLFLDTTDILTLLLFNGGKNMKPNFRKFMKRWSWRLWYMYFWAQIFSHFGATPDGLVYIGTYRKLCYYWNKVPYKHFNSTNQALIRH